MITLYKNIRFTANNQSIYADSLSVQQSVGVSQIGFVGGNNYNAEVVEGDFPTVIQGNYTMAFQNDPFWLKISGLAANPMGNMTPLTLNFGGLSGSFYLQNLSFSVGANFEATKASFGAISFYPLSGEFAGISTFENTANPRTQLSNSYKTSIQSSGNIECINFDYEGQIQFKPKYKIGSQFPVNVFFIKTAENIGFETLNPMSYHLSGYSLTGQLGISGISFAALDGTNNISMPLQNFNITSFNRPVQKADILRYSVSCSRNR